MTIPSWGRPVYPPAESGPLALGAVGLLLWIVAVSRADFSKMGDFGLVTVLGWPYFVGLILVVVGFTWEMNRHRSSDHRMIMLTLVLMVFIFGTSSAVAPIASLGDSWLHAGYVQFFLQHGHTLSNYDARFSWPGGFSLGAILVAFAGQANALGFLRWFPLFIEMCYLAPVLVIARFSGVSRRTAWLGVALFYASNWIYQDYFSPQALNYLFMLVVIATVLAYMRPRLDVPRSRVMREFQKRLTSLSNRVHFVRPPVDEPSNAQSPIVARTLYGLTGLVCFASAISHQLTPYAIVLALSAAFVTHRLGRPELVVLTALFAVGWLSLGAADFWTGHLTTIFGSVGNISSTIGSNVTQRLNGSTSHRVVVESRILITGSLYFLAGIGVLIRRPPTRTLETLAAAPFLLVLAQNYGGEALLRVTLYGLPFTALLAASAIMPNRTAFAKRLVARLQISRSTRRAARLATVTVIVFVFSLATFFVRGGNDAYESFSLGELAAVNYVYDHVKTGQTIGMVIPYLPLGQRDIGSVHYFPAAEAGIAPTLENLRREFLKIRPDFIILSASQRAWGTIIAGYPPDWESRLRIYLTGSRYQMVAQWSTATVLKSVGP